MRLGTLARATALATVLATAVAGLAWAEWYTRLDAGYSVDGGIETANGDLEFDDDWSGHAGLGYAFANGFRLEAEGAYRQNEFSAFDGDANATSLMANLYYDFNRDGAIRPYVGIGAGGAKVDVSGVAGPITFDNDDTVAAYQGMAGVAFPLGQRVDLDVGYRYFKAPDTALAGRINTGDGFTPFSFDSDYVHEAVTVGLRFKFGAAAAPAAVVPVQAPPPPPQEPPPPPPPTPCAASEFVVYFEWDRSSLNDAAIQTIDSAVANARACNVANVVIVGHTDTSGSNRYNVGLSERRANIVREAMVARGIAGDSISTQARGETDLANPTRDGVRDPLNRRTAVTISFR